LGNPEFDPTTGTSLFDKKLCANSGIGLAAAKDVWPNHVTAANMVLYSLAILGVLLLILRPCRHLPGFLTGIFVAMPSIADWTALS
jgi:hypothetical protein